MRARKAITRLDEAVHRAEADRVELMDALAEAYESEAWKTDEDFTAKRARGDFPNVQPEHWFTVWAQDRYGFSRQHIHRLASAGRVRALMPSPAGDVPEWSIRQLTPLLARPDAAESIPQVWKAAEAAARGNPRKLGAAIRDVIASDRSLRRTVKAKKRETERSIDAELTRWRKLTDWLAANMDDASFQERVVAWLRDRT